MATALGVLTETAWNPTEGQGQAWSLSENNNNEGFAIPEIYGTLRITPPRIGRYLESNGQAQTLNLLYALSKWQVDSVTGIRINGDDIANFPEVPPPIIRYGDNYQEIVQAFADTIVDTYVSSPLTYATWITRTTAGSDCTGIGVGIVFPSGLYVDFGQQEIAPASVQVQIQYKLHSASTWTSLSVTTATRASVSVARWSAGYWGTDSANGMPVWCELDEGSTGATDQTEGERYYPGETSWVLAGFMGDTYQRPVIFWHWLAIADSAIPESAILTEYVGIMEARKGTFRRAYFRTGLTPGKYDIRVKFYADPPADVSPNKYVHDVNFDFFRESIEDDLTYPNVALLGISAFPTDKLSGGEPTVDVLVTRSTVLVYNPTLSAYEDKPATNPAWICYDLLHKARSLGDADPLLADHLVVYGVPHARLDTYYAQWAAWAAWCDWSVTAPYTTKKPYTCNIYFDETISLQDALDMVGAVGRGKVCQFGMNLIPIFERPEVTPVQRFVFSNANVLRDSFSETFSASTDRANIIEVSYQETTNFYEKEIVRIPAADFDTNQGLTNSVSIDLRGCTDRDAAAAYGKYILNRQRYLTAVSSWSADIDSIACTLGDIVEAPADYGGRLLTGCTTTSLLLDQPVVIEAGKTYHVILNHQDDDTREETAVTTTTPGTYSTIAVTALTRAPAVDARYLFGEEGQEARLRRVIAITRDGDLRRRITAEEFDNAVFADAVTILPLPFDPTRWRMIPPPLASISLSLEWILDTNTKTWIPNVRVVFNPDLTFDYQKLTIPLDHLRVYCHVDSGDTHTSPMSVGMYGSIFDYRADTIDAPAGPWNNTTLYMTAALVNIQGMEGPKCDPAVFYINTAFTPAPSTSNLSIDSYDYTNNGPNGYTAKISWVPYGWELNAGKYRPIQIWNSGSNYYVFQKYVIVYGPVVAQGNIPSAADMIFIELPDIGNIFDDDGTRITDADVLDDICRAAASTALSLMYGPKYIAVAVFPLVKGGAVSAVDFNQADFGLDWEYIYQPVAGGVGNRVTDNQITNAELVYTMQNGAVFLNEMNWDYALTSPNIDGFAVILRVQKYWWSWLLSGSIASSVISMATIVAAVDVSSGGGGAAAADFAARYNEWYAGGVSHFYMMIADATNHEIIKVNAQTLVVTRGVEGTTARNWSAGACISYSPCELIDHWAPIMDTTQRSFTFPSMFEIEAALHCVIVAVKLTTGSPGYRRSNYAFWDAVRSR